MDGKPIKFKNDLEGNVWLCGKNLLASYPAEQFRIISKINNQPITHVHSVLCDRNHQLWFTPYQGLIKYNVVMEVHKVFF